MVSKSPGYHIYKLLTMIGRCFTIVPRSEAPYGYYDMDIDDYPDGSKADVQEYTMINTSHRIQVKAAEQ